MSYYIIVTRFINFILCIIGAKYNQNEFDVQMLAVQEALKQLVQNMNDKNYISRITKIQQCSITINSILSSCENNELSAKLRYLGCCLASLFFCLVIVFNVIALV